MAKTQPATPSYVVEVVPIDSLKPYAKNAKRHPQKQVEALAKSLRKYGWTVPLMADKDSSVVGGHGRLLAAMYCRDHNWEIANWPDTSLAPVRRLEHMSPGDVKAYRIADNRLAEMGEWDNGILAAELSELNADSNLDLTGFTGADLEEMLGAAKSGGKGGRRNAQAGTPVISYNLIFQTEDQHKAWATFLKTLKAKYPNAETIAERVIAYIQESPPGHG